MKLTLLFFAFALSVTAQDSSSVIFTTVTDTEMDSSSSYIYCTTSDIMWNELRNYIEETPKTVSPNSTIEKLNNRTENSYQSPIEEQYVVAKAGLVKDHIVRDVNRELLEKFETYWNAPSDMSSEALIAYSHLKKNVAFRISLDDEFYNQPFNNGTHVDYFGLDADDPRHSKPGLRFHDYKSKDNFILQVKCKDSLDEIYFAKIPAGATLETTYQAAMERIQLNNITRIPGKDVVKIPYIEFDTTVAHSALTSATLTNERIAGKQFLSVQQWIDFELNPDGIKLESNMAAIIDFADFETDPPMVYALDKSFLMIMKRKNSDAPYFLYWVSGVEFMRSYILSKRSIEEYENVFVGTWNFMEKVSEDGTKTDTSFLNRKIEFKSDGTIRYYKYDFPLEGTWRYEPNEGKMVIQFLSRNNTGGTANWSISMPDDTHFSIGEKVHFFYEKNK